MGPTNVALVTLFKADQQLRQAQARLETASRDVRIQRRRTDDLQERLRFAQSTLMETRSRLGQVELDLKTRDAHIDKLRQQQQNARNNKEYQAFLVEINTEKVDKAKVEDELIKLMEQVEKGQKEHAELENLLAAERERLQSMQTEIDERLKSLQAEIDALQEPRETAYHAVPPKARDVFDRLAERHDGEALSAVSKPDRRREEYVCSACNMELVTDVYNKLHSRDELIFCPSCRRVLYIPEDLPPETAVHKKKVPKPRKEKPPADSGIGAVATRQQSAVDVMNSITPEPDEPEAVPEPASPPEPNDATIEGAGA
jgi:predicted  nucleic acid-binding Zn-ribbon protein